MNPENPTYKQISRKSRAISHEIILESFINDKQVNWMLDSHLPGFDKRYDMLMRFLFEECVSTGSVSVDDSESCTFYLRDGRKSPWKSWRYALMNLAFIWRMGIKRTLKIIKMSDVFFEGHPSNGQYIYLCMTGALAKARGTGIFSRFFDHVMNGADTEKLPVYLETSSARNVKIYESRGFEVYGEWKPNDDSELVVWLMRREPKL